MDRLSLVKFSFVALLTPLFLVSPVHADDPAQAKPAQPAQPAQPDQPDQPDQPNEVKLQLGYSHLFGEVHSFGVGTLGGSFRRRIAGRVSLEPEFTRTRGSRRRQNSANGLLRAVIDLKPGDRVVPYAASGFGVHSSGGDFGLTALLGIGARVTVLRGLFVSPELRLAFPFLETRMPGLVVALGYGF